MTYKYTCIDCYHGEKDETSDPCLKCIKSSEYIPKEEIERSLRQKHKTRRSKK